jgi:hypothetical protein
MTPIDSLIKSFIWLCPVGENRSSYTRGFPSSPNPETVCERNQFWATTPEMCHNPGDSEFHVCFPKPGMGLQRRCPFDKTADESALDQTPLRLRDTGLLEVPPDFGSECFSRDAPTFLEIPISLKIFHPFISDI